MARPVLLIAGGSRGIGACTAKFAGARGYDVAVNYKSNTKAAADVVDAVKAAGGKAVAIQGDMVSEETIERVFDQATKELGPITHFVHCAGIGGKNSKLEAASAATIREVIDVNLYGGILCARAAVRRMSTANGGKGGSIVMLGSIASVTGGAGEYVFYAAAKGGIDALTVGLAREVAKEGIRFNTIRPGPTKTDIHEPGRLERITPLLPMARPTIVVGINQTIMAALAMVTIAALIDAPGLGKTVLKALETQDVGTAFNAGLAIVVLAIVLDRVTAAAAARGARARRRTPRLARDAVGHVRPASTHGESFRLHQRRTPRWSARKMAHSARPRFRAHG